MAPALRRSNADQIHLYDALALLWVVAWLAVGAWVGHEIWQLSRLGETLSSSGRALDDSGRALQELRDLPLIGDAPGSIGDDVRATAAEVVRRGEEARSSTRQLAVLLGVGVAVAPLVPVLLYLPLRVAVTGDRRRVQAMLRRGGQDVDTHLARRALAEVPYDRLLQVSDTPEEDFAQGRRRGLADAQLAHLGLRRDGT